MKKFLLLILLIFSWIFSQAQTWDWAKSIPTTTRSVPYDVTVDAWGNVYSASYFVDTLVFNNTTYISEKSRSADMLLVKWDSMGGVIWSKQLECGNVGWSTHNSPTLATDYKGDLYLTSAFNFSMEVGMDTLISYNYECLRCPDSCFDPVYGCDCDYDTITCYTIDPYLMKLDPQGNLIWVKQFSNREYMRVYDMQVDKNLNVYIAGNFRDTIYLDSHMVIENGVKGRDDFYLAKIDSNQQVQWATSGGSASRDRDAGYSLVVDCDQNVYLSGLTRDTANFDGVILNEAGAFAAKYDSIGNCLWATNLDSAAYGIAIDIDKNGNCYVGGAYTSMFISKLDSLGHVIWKQTPSSGIYSNALNDLKVDDQGNTYFTGFIKKPTQFDTLRVFASSIQAYVASYSTQGNVRWVMNASGSTVEGIDLDLGTNNDIMLAGLFNFTAHFGNDRLESAAPLGNLNTYVSRIKVPFIPETDTCPRMTNVAIGPDRIERQVHVFPNPTTGQLMLDLRKERKDVYISIRNIAGQQILTQKMAFAKKTLIDIKGPAGLYFVVVHAAGGLGETFKVIKE